MVAVAMDTRLRTKMYQFFLKSLENYFFWPLEIKNSPIFLKLGEMIGLLEVFLWNVGFDLWKGQGHLEWGQMVKKRPKTSKIPSNTDSYYYKLWLKCS